MAEAEQAYPPPGADPMDEDGGGDEGGDEEGGEGGEGAPAQALGSLSQPVADGWRCIERAHEPGCTTCAGGRIGAAWGAARAKN